MHQHKAAERKGNQSERDYRVVEVRPGLTLPTYVKWDEQIPIDSKLPGRRASVSLTSDKRMYFWSVGWERTNGPCGFRKTFRAAERICINFMKTGKTPR